MLALAVWLGSRLGTRRPSGSTRRLVGTKQNTFFDTNDKQLLAPLAPMELARLMFMKKVTGQIQIRTQNLSCVIIGGCLLTCGHYMRSSPLGNEEFQVTIDNAVRKAILHKEFPKFDLAIFLLSDGQLSFSHSFPLEYVQGSMLTEDLNLPPSLPPRLFNISSIVASNVDGAFTTNLAEYINSFPDEIEASKAWENIRRDYASNFYRAYDAIMKPDRISYGISTYSKPAPHEGNNAIYHDSPGLYGIPGGALFSVKGGLTIYGVFSGFTKVVEIPNPCLVRLIPTEVLDAIQTGPVWGRSRGSLTWMSTITQKRTYEEKWLW